jgi:cell division protein FtsQ
VLEAPEEDYAPEARTPRRTSATPARKLRRDFREEFDDDSFEDDDAPAGRRSAGVRVRFRGGLPTSTWGRIAAGVAVLFCVGFCFAVFLVAKSLVLHDERFVIPSSSSIEIEGNSHLTRAQLLSIFGEDVERNIFTISLAQRRAQLERLPWVEHATVMRLLPNRMRVSIAERTPVAFVRQGNHIGLVDANGVLLDMPTDSELNTHYSFPVVTGISADEPVSTRAARMKIYQRFTSELDGSGEKISQTLSEVDLSNPEDVKALIPDHSSEVLVHFGEDSFLDRYRKFEEHLPEWRTQYPKLSSVDMRYERQVVLEMQPGSAVPVAPSAGAVAPEASADAPAAASKPSAKAVAKPIAKTHTVAGKAKPASKAAPHRVAPTNHSGAKARPNAPAASPAKHSAATVKPTASEQYHPSQVVHP